LAAEFRAQLEANSTGGERALVLEPEYLRVIARKR
jgi:hypothetical protein